MSAVRPLSEILRSRSWEDRQHRQLRELAAITIDRQETRIEALERENAELREAGRKMHRRSQLAESVSQCAVSTLETWLKVLYDHQSKKDRTLFRWVLRDLTAKMQRLSDRAALRDAKERKG